MFAQAIHIDDVFRYMNETLSTYVVDSPPTCDDEFQTQEENIYEHLWYKNNFNKWYGKTFSNYQLGEMNCYLKQADPMNYEPTDDTEHLVNSTIAEWMLKDNRGAYYGIITCHILNRSLERLSLCR